MINIIKYLFNKKYREAYTQSVIENSTKNFKQYEEVYKVIKRDNSKANQYVNNLRKSA
ncbi:hypothetical protein SDC9_96708 [bioreactor metagenome]|uniref:Uncharacterized protein n=1 Tax=bioreactor metagenome TaxID=1076179 RepID=A0A645AJY4_9ZZZZ